MRHMITCMAGKNISFIGGNRINKFNPAFYNFDNGFDPSIGGGGIGTIRLFKIFVIYNFHIVSLPVLSYNKV